MDDATYWAMMGALAQAVGALATFLAVGASLWIALSERRPRLGLTVSVLLLFGDDQNEEWIGFSVVNKGQQPVRIASYGWRTGFFKRQHAMINHAQNHAFQPPLPYTLAPGDKVTFLNDPQVFLGEVHRIPDFFAWAFRGRWHPRHIEGAVHLAVGSSKRVKVSSSVRDLVVRQLRVVPRPGQKKAGH